MFSTRSISPLEESLCYDSEGGSFIAFALLVKLGTTARNRTAPKPLLAEAAVASKISPVFPNPNRLTAMGMVTKTKNLPAFTSPRVLLLL